MGAIKKLDDILIWVIKAILMVFGTVMTVLVITNVIMRYGFNSGLTWSEEAARFLFIYTTFLGSMLGAHYHAHMRLDFIVEKFHGNVRKCIEILAHLVVLALSAFLFYGGIEVIKVTWMMPTSALKIPKGSIYLGAPICFGYWILITIVDIILVIGRKGDGDTEEKKEVA